MTTAETTLAVPAALEPGMSPFQRMAAVFARPAHAWSGLPRQVQFWFPMLAVLLVTMAGNLLLHDRALVPMLAAQWEEQVADGQMTAEAYDQALRFFDSPAGKIAVAVQQLVFMPLFTLFAGLLVWFGVGFVLGSRMSYRLALEVAAWAGLITIPGYLATAAISWFRETMRGVHVGFGILLPETESPDRTLTVLGVILDSIGPFGIWYVAVAVLGAAALSGAPRGRVAWVIGGLYLLAVAFSAGITAMQIPG